MDHPSHQHTIKRNRLLVVLAAAIALVIQLAHGDTNTASGASESFDHGYAINQYEVIGSTSLTKEVIDHVMQGAVGTNVSLQQIRHALAKLRDTYKERGFQQVLVTLPAQNLENGTVQINVRENSAATPHTLYDIQHFEIRGNRTLTGEEIDAILSKAAGPITSLDQLRTSLSDLQAAYRAHGLRRASVTLPPQFLTDGTITIHVNEGPTAENEAAVFNARFSPATNQLAVPSARTFTVNSYEIAGNTLLPEQVVKRAFVEAIGTNVSFNEIQKALGQLQMAYRERGYVTASVGLPQQRLTNATVKVQVTEGKLVDVRVTGNKHFDSNNVLRALPSLSTNQILNARILQRELDLANQNRDRQIYPTINPGPDPGTSALNLKVQDRLPLHGRAELNNYSTPGTPYWRINTSLSYNNLWQREHQVGLSYAFTPEQYKTEGDVPDYLLNRPLVANYGAYYRIPFGAESVAQSVATSARFGYDEATRQFRLPPAGPRPDITVFASEASTDTGVRYGSDQVVTKTPLLGIVSEDSGQDVTINDTAGGRFSIPLSLTDTRHFSLSAGPDFRHFQLRSFNTNNFIITTVVTNAGGSQTIESRVASPQPAFTADVVYLPLSLTSDYSQVDRGGTLSLGAGLSWNTFGQDKDFSALSYSKKARADFGKATFSILRDQKLGTWSTLLRASAQAATCPLISAEQFGLGGVSSIRGYYEGDEFGDSGWTSSVELRTPFLASEVPLFTKNVPVWLRAAAFVDGGQRYQIDTFRGHDPYRSLLGTGFGLSANINNHFDMRLAVGWPLIDSANTRTRDPRAYFSLGGQF